MFYVNPIGYSKIPSAIKFRFLFLIYLVSNLWLCNENEIFEWGSLVGSVAFSLLNIFFGTVFFESKNFSLRNLKAKSRSVRLQITVSHIV